MDEEEYLDALVDQSPPILFFDPEDPNSIESLDAMAAENASYVSASAQNIDALRHQLGTDEYGDPTYRYLMPEDILEPLGRTWLFNFDKSDFEMSGTSPKSSNLIDEQKRDHVLIAQWIMRVLNTERYMYTAYPDWFGVELKPIWMGELVGMPAMVHLRNQIEEALLVHDRIRKVDVIELAEEDGTIRVVCDVFLDDNEKVLSLSVVGMGGEFYYG